MSKKIRGKIVEIKSEIKKVFSNLGYMFKFSWGISKAWFFISAINMVVRSVTPFVFLFLPKYIIDELGGEKRWDVVLKYIIILMAATAFIKAFNWGTWYLQSETRQKAILKNERVFLSMNLGMEYGNFENSNVRDLGERVRTNIDVLNFIGRIIPEFLTNLFQLIGYTYIIAQLHPLIIAVILLIIYINSKIAKKRQEMNYEFQPIVANFSRRASYVYNSMIGFDAGKDIRINKASEWLKNKYSAETGKYIGKFVEKQNKEFRFSLFDNVVASIQTIIMYGYSAYMAIIGKITIGSFSVYLGAITNFTASFTNTVSQFIGIRFWSYFIDDFRRYKEIAALNPTDKINENIKKDDLIEGGCEIEFADVSFKYPNTDRYVLKNISLKINNKEKLSIVGYNGAGKSTLIKLLCRLYEPTEGKIFYNGIDISTINYKLYSDLLSVVFQDHQLFPFSVEENIVLAQEYDEKKLLSSLEKSDISGKIKTLANGLKTSISKEFDSEGIEFSGGEGQKLATARAYYKDSPIVILDEPTAALDPIAEGKLYKRFNDIMTDKTAIYISHRLASSRFCDKIAVFADGELVEYGTHGELIAKKGLYNEMFSVQAEYYKEEALSK